MARKTKKHGKRDVVYAFRTTQEVCDELERVAIENSRTKSQQCDYFIRECLKKYQSQKDGKSHEHGH